MNIKAVAGSPSHQSIWSNLSRFFASGHVVNRHVDELRSRRNLDEFGFFKMFQSDGPDPKLSSCFAENRSFGIKLRCSFTCS